MIKPKEVEIPKFIKDPKKYMEGFQHGLVSNRLDIVPGHEDDRMYGFKQSFRLGFRAAKLYLIEKGLSGGTDPTKLKVK